MAHHNSSPCCLPPEIQEEQHSSATRFYKASSSSIHGTICDDGCSKPKTQADLGIDKVDRIHEKPRSGMEGYGEEGNHCCSEEEGRCSCNDKCFQKYAAYIHKNSHLDEASLEIGSNANDQVTPYSTESLHHDHQNDYWHEKPHGHHDCSYEEAESCPSCLRRAESGGTSILSSRDSSIMRCYCASMKAITSSIRKVTPITTKPCSRTAGWGCCNVSQYTADSNCCYGKTSLDEKLGEEEFIVDIGRTAVLATRFLSLTVTGMTCTGCADKVVYVLRSMNGVRPDSVKVSFLNNRAEMTFLPEIRGEDAIVERLRKKTGFRVAVMDSGSLEEAGLVKVRIEINEDENFDIIEKSDGVRNLKFLSREKERILLEVGYDPVVIGIRDLLGYINRRNDKLDASVVDTPDEETIVSEAERKHLRLLGITTLTAILLTAPILVLAWSPLPNVDESHKYFVQMPLATATMGMAYRIYLNASRTIIYGGAGGSRVDMDVLVMVATLAAWGLSVTIFIIDFVNDTLGETGREPFFETCSLLVSLILAGRWITGRVRMWALNRVVVVGDEKKEGPKTVLLVEDGTIREIDKNLIQYADVLVAEKGDIISTDGVVVDGEAEIDESLLTGEAKPAVIGVGKLVMAGSNIVNGRLRYRVIRLMHENTVSVIKRMVRSAGGEKPKVQELADRFAAILTPAVLAISVIVFTTWLFVGGLGRHKHWPDSAVDAISYAVATLAVSCPCAIGLAVPMVMVFASRVAMRKGGFLFVNVGAVEKGWKTNKVVFDKTGTLTTGKLDVVFKKAHDGNDWGDEVSDQIRALVKVLCEGEKHPVSRALAASVGSVEDYPEAVIENVVGKGIEAIIENQLVRGGRPSWCTPNGEEHPLVKGVIERGLTVFALSIDNELKAVFGLEDTIRPEAAGVIAELHRRCIETYIFSGDHKHAVGKVAQILGIPEQNCYSSCSPEQKSSEIKTLQQRLLHPVGSDRSHESGRSTVLFVGDGTNDAVALTQADVGLSMSDSTSVAVSAADVAILSTSLRSIVNFLDLSKRIKICIWVSFAWAVLWNFFAVLAAGGAFVVVRIAPEWAGLGELGSVLPVVVIAAFVGVRWRRLRCSSNLGRTLVP